MIRRGQPGSRSAQSGQSVNASVFTEPAVQKTPRALPPTPARKSAQSVHAASTTAPQAQFFQPAVELPQPRAGADINEQVRHWARISAPKYNPQQVALAFENAKKLIDTGSVDFSSTAPKGNTAIHNAALVNNIAFIDYVMTHEKYLGNVDIDLFNTQANQNALGAAITSDFFELAIKLITTYNAKIDGTSRLVIYDQTLEKKLVDNTFDVLRLALRPCLRVKTQDSSTDQKDQKVLSDEQKSTLDKLIKILLDKKLNFFQTKNKLFPAVFEFENFWVKPSDADKIIMQNSFLTEAEFSKLLLLDILKKDYPATFQGFWSQLETAKDSGNDTAQNFWRIWHARELATSHRVQPQPQTKTVK